MINDPNYHSGSAAEAFKHAVSEAFAFSLDNSPGCAPGFPSWGSELPGPVYQRMKDKAAILRGQAVLVVAEPEGRIADRLGRDFSFLAHSDSLFAASPAGLNCMAYFSEPTLVDTVLACCITGQGDDLYILAQARSALRRVGRLVAVVSEAGYNNPAFAGIRARVDSQADVNRPLEPDDFGFDTRLIMIDQRLQQE